MVAGQFRRYLDSVYDGFTSWAATASLAMRTTEAMQDAMDCIQSRWLDGSWRLWGERSAECLLLRQGLDDMRGLRRSWVSWLWSLRDHTQMRRAAQWMMNRTTCKVDTASPRCKHPFLLHGA